MCWPNLSMSSLIPDCCFYFLACDKKVSTSSSPGGTLCCECQSLMSYGGGPKHLNARKLKRGPMDPDHPTPMIRLGYLDEINKRRTHCAFCRLVVHVVAKNRKFNENAEITTMATQEGIRV